MIAPVWNLFKVMSRTAPKIVALLGPRQAPQSPTIANRASWECPFCSKVRLSSFLADLSMIAPLWNLFKVMGRAAPKILALLGPRQAPQSSTVANRVSWECPFCSKVRLLRFLADLSMIAPLWNLLCWQRLGSGRLVWVTAKPQFLGQ